ncbi:MAG: YdjY domain-containing protein [Thermoguttaceae bacterium]
MAMRLPPSIFPMTLLAAFLGLASTARADEPEPAPKPRDLGPPLVENLKDLKQLGKYSAWLDTKKRQVVLVGEACKADYPLEFFITTKARAYESVLVIEGDRRQEGQMSVFQQVQLALILCGAKPGHPSYYKDDKTTVATGDEITIEVRWKNQEGKTEHADARNWIRDVKTKKPPTKTWVFAGSRFADDGEGGKRFMADGGEFVCVLNNPIAMLDLPVVSAGAIEDRSFEANLEKLPPPGTPVTIALIPKVRAKGGEKK